MSIYVVQTSSLYPIDLAAALYAGVLDRQAQFRIFLSDVAELPSDMQARQFVARSALPTGYWCFDRVGGWRQIHIPLEMLQEADDFANALQQVGKSLSTGDNDLDGQIITRCKQLSTQAMERMQFLHGEYKSQWAKFAAAIITEVFEQVLGQHAVEVSPYWQFRCGDYGSLSLPDRQIYLQAIERLLSYAREIFPKRIVFIDGGHLEFYLSTNPNIWNSFSALSFDGKTIELVGESGTSRVPYTQDILFRFRFRGPLEIFQLQQFGTLVDLPWYADARLSYEPGFNFTGIEFISPITAKSSKRISQDYSGLGYRLIPSGYSLIEFDTKLVSVFLQHKLKIPSATSESLADWRDLIERFPRASQRLSKHQLSVKAYRNLREIEMQRKIKQGYMFSIMDRGIERLNPLLYGEHLIGLVALTELLKEWTSPHCPSGRPDAVLQFLTQIHLLDSDGNFLLKKFVSVLQDALEFVGGWLETHAWIVPKEMENSFSRATGYMVQTEKVSITNPTCAQTPAGLGFAVAALRDLADAYYSFAAFCCAVIFKAHILFPYLLLGPEEYRCQIEKIIHARTSATKLNFDPILWTTE